MHRRDGVQGLGKRPGSGRPVQTAASDALCYRAVPLQELLDFFLLAQIPPDGDAQKFLETLEESSLVDALVGSVTQNLLDVVVDLLLLVIGLGDLSHLLSFANLFLDKFDQGKC